jgi:hypothetical protein
LGKPTGRFLGKAIIAKIEVVGNEAGFQIWGLASRHVIIPAR